MTSGAFDISGSNGFTLRATWTAEHGQLTLGLQLKSAGYYGITLYLGGSISVNGKTIYTFDSGAGGVQARIEQKGVFAPITPQFAPISVSGSRAELELTINGSTQSGGVKFAAAGQQIIELFSSGARIWDGSAWVDVQPEIWDGAAWQPHTEQIGGTS